jgi:TolB protein
VSLIALATPVLAQQQDTSKLPPGVELEMRYSKAGRPLIAVRPFTVSITGAGPAAQITSIVINDLTLSDRFEMMPVPESLTSPDSLRYEVWNSLNVVYLITGDVQPSGSGYQLLLTAHDVVYGREKQSGTFQLPGEASADFRMAVHAAADAVVKWLTGQPGMAATRIAFQRVNQNSFDIMSVDYDGENLRRLFGSPEMVYSPAWSPDGSRMAYALKNSNKWQLVERELASGRTRTLANGDLVSGVSYSPDGSRILFDLWIPGRGVAQGLEIHSYDVATGRITKLTESTQDNLLGSLSPDGRRMVFLSTRTGRQHIYVADADGSNARVLTPFGERVQYNGPEWSPVGTKIAFHGQSQGTFQIMVADATRLGGQVTQLTSRGENQDPSWAPDGRHIVYTGSGAEGEGLYVIDTTTGNIRMLTRGRRLRFPDWSMPLATPALASQ